MDDKTPFVLPDQTRRNVLDALETADPPCSSAEMRGSGVVDAVVASEASPLPPDLSLGSLQPDLSAWGTDATNSLDGVLQSLLVPCFEWSGELIDRTCKYRKGRCSQPRTRKRNGDLHSYCEHHRQKSIQNQRKFDRKRRLQRLADLANFEMPRVRADDRDVPLPPCSHLEGEDCDKPRGDAPDKHCSRAAQAVDEQTNDGICHCGSQCKDVRYDITFITGA